jgi:hypothetical protein
LADEIEALLEDADARNPDLDEIFNFIETAQAEVGGEEVVARLAAREGSVELDLPHFACCGWSFRAGMTT